MKITNFTLYNVLITIVISAVFAVPVIHLSGNIFQPLLVSSFGPFSWVIFFNGIDGWFPPTTKTPYDFYFFIILALLNLVLLLADSIKSSRISRILAIIAAIWWIFSGNGLLYIAV